MQPQRFQDRGFVELGHLDKLFVKNTRKKDPTGRCFGAFSPRYSCNYILNGRFKLALSPASCVPVNYARILNMPRYCFNKITTIVTVIMLEFLSARFEHPAALLLLSFSNGN